LADARKDCGKLVRKLVLQRYGATTDLDQWRDWCREVQAGLPEDWVARRRVLKRLVRDPDRPGAPLAGVMDHIDDPDQPRAPLAGVVGHDPDQPRAPQAPQARATGRGWLPPTRGASSAFPKGSLPAAERPRRGRAVVGR
jgi:hypothetical protein